MAVQLIERPAETLFANPDDAELEQYLHREITFEVYLKMPVTKLRHEIVDGELIMSPAPTDIHQLDQGEHYESLKDFVKKHDLGRILMAPIDLIIRKVPKLSVRQPDIAFFSWESIGTRDKYEYQAARKQGLMPDLVVEILSPGNSKRKFGHKLKDYAEVGIREVWLVSREAVTIEVLVRRDGEYNQIGLYGSGQKISSMVLRGLDIVVDSLFAR